MSSTVTTPEPDQPCEEDKYLHVTFNPELYLQRQQWILEVLRANRVSSVLDIGCGGGALLSCLLEPAQTTDTEPLETEPALNIHLDLHLKEVAGIDVCLESLVSASQHLLSPSRLENSSEKREPWQPAHFRWESLTAKLWHGSLDSFNPEFVYDARTGTGYEAIVAQEVIEHLVPEVLDKFAPVLLGLYRPQFLLVTTPAYDFNARFTAPGIEDPRAFLDPTNRTERRFRHDDHKLEFTRAEFHDYCVAAAHRFGYTVTIEHVGLPQEQDPYADLRDVGAATQCALFVLSNLPLLPAPIPTLPTPPTLHCDRFFPAHPSLPLESAEILGLIGEGLTLLKGDSADLHTLWYFAEGVSVACAGSLSRLVGAVRGEPDNWELTPAASSRWWDAIVRWKAFVPLSIDDDLAAPRPSDWENDSTASWTMSDPPAWSDAEEPSADPAIDDPPPTDSATTGPGSGWDDEPMSGDHGSSWPATIFTADPAYPANASSGGDWSTSDLEPVRA
ncbi:hypothetical protein AURDEDRAFT_188426 [Auricularia subglabra TFB-10046 SS5]|uniref:Small RNA 2'-O-methyltransferase n=1 Tax=Auricularia subglabra (strain TFB-10046 / SS5) TaxID=717982 RepID=J0WU37_AURST|nr:hypothetical protein AURDEDRAFT_188426 [Auricularia subglabra TFB-10046 SS5]